MWDDDVARLGVLCVSDWVVQEADDPDDPAHFPDPAQSVAGVTQQLLTAEHLHNRELFVI